LTTLYRSTHRRCRGGAPVENLAHSASFHSKENNAPSKPGIKHLGYEFQRMADQMNDASLNDRAGKTASIASRKPFRPSTTAIRMSPTPRFLSTFITLSQNFAPSVFSIHNIRRYATATRTRRRRSTRKRCRHVRQLPPANSLNHQNADSGI
jgi:hypothetical protein